MNHVRTGLSISALLSTMLLLAACGSSDDSTKTATPPTAATSTSAPLSGGAEASGTVNITAQNFAFAPDSAKAEKGKALTVNFQNADTTTHTLTFYSDDQYAKKISGADTGRVGAGANATFTFNISSDASDLYFRCDIHNSMKGEVSTD